MHKINDKTKKSVRFGMTLPYKILRMIDKERGDIPRSKFILRLIEVRYKPMDCLIEPVEDGNITDGLL